MVGLTCFLSFKRFFLWLAFGLRGTVAATKGSAPLRTTGNGNSRTEPWRLHRMVGLTCFLSFKRFFLWLAFGFRLDSRRYQRLVAASNNRRRQFREPSHGDCTQWSGSLASFRSNAFSFGPRLASGWTVAATEDLPRTDSFPNGPSRIQSALILQFCERYLNFRRT
jgi:hypothetical protein